MKKATSIFATMILSSMALAGCGASNTANNTSSNATSDNSQKTIGVLISGQDAPYLASYVKGLQQEADKEHVKLTILDAQWHVDKQAYQLQDLITKHVDAIILNAVDAKAIIPALVKAQSSNIPIIAGNVGLDAEGNKYIKAFTGADSITEGKGAADLMAQALNGKGNVVEVLGSPGMEPSVNRKKGFEDEIAKVAPGIKVIGSEVGAWDKAKSVTAMENLLTANPNIQGVYAEDDTMATGAIQALKEHKISNVKVVGIGGSTAGLNAIKSGDMYGTNLQSPMQDGAEAVKIAVEIMGGQKVPFNNYIDIPKITKDNVDQFTPEW